MDSLRNNLIRRFDRRKRGNEEREGEEAEDEAGGRWLDRKDVRFSTCVGRSSRPARRKTAPARGRPHASRRAPEVTLTTTRFVARDDTFRKEGKHRWRFKDN